MNSYGMKATVTCVVNDDKYDMGFTYSDSDGNDLDKQLSGDMDNMENDVTKAVFDAYVDILINKRKKKKQAKVAATSQPETITSTPVVHAKITSTPIVHAKETVDRFAELEEENRRLNEKIDAFLGHKTPSTDSNRKDEGKKESYKPQNEQHHRNPNNGDDLFTTPLSSFSDLESVLKFLGL